MKAHPARSNAPYQSDASAGVGHWRLGYDDFKVLAALSDVSAIILASIVTGAAYHWIAYGRVGSVVEFFGVGAISAGLAAAPLKLRGLYTTDSLLSVRRQIAPILFIWSGVVLFVLGISFTLKISEDLSRGSILSLALIAPYLILGQRFLLQNAMLTVLQRGRLTRSKVVVITGESKATAADHETQPTQEIIATYELPRDPGARQHLLTKITSAARGSNTIGEVHLVLDWTRWSDMKQLLTQLRILPVPVRLVADATAREILQYPEHRVDGIISFELQRAPLTAGERAAKRLFDIAGSAAGLCVIAPLLLAVSLAVRINSPGPILFKQTRGGFNGRTFQILKFRTMHVMEDGPTITQASSHDDRVTGVGRWLRRFSIDELPQLINVLRGDMSLVGPRPHALAHDVHYSSLIANYPYRHHVKPGITGWAQVNGFRGETSTVGLMKQRIELDLWYVTNWSFWLDLRILFRTLVEVYRTRNAF
jgi:Undecaprenyl-phosphate glucose phosphotransferase